MKSILYILSLVFVFAIVSCGKNYDVNPSSTLLKVAEAYNGAGTKVIVYAKDSLAVGYNPIFIQLKDSASGAAITRAEVSINPVMKMMSMSHSCPIENPSSSTANADGYFTAASVFIMPSNDMEYWNLNITAKNTISGKTGTASPKVWVKNSANLKSLTSTIDAAKVFVAWVQPTKPVVGINDLEFVVYTKQDMMHFPAASGYKIAMTPSMPSMGHSSPNNVDPVHQSNGHYKGKVNFTMTGLWRVDLVLTKTGVSGQDALYFETTF